MADRSADSPPAAADAGAPSGCPPGDSFAALLAGNLSPAESSSLHGHIRVCARCGQLLALLGATTDASPSEPAASDGADGFAAELRRPGSRVGRFVLERLIGMGGMGTVWAARDPELGRSVAIKLVRPGASGGDESAHRQRLLREAQAMARLAHPNVVAVYDVGSHEGQVFVAMELVAGTTLQGFLRERGHGWRAVLEQFVRAGRGLQAAHAAGVVHRDFKPDNVLVGDDGRVRVTDFGLARPLDESVELTPGSGPPELSRPGTFAGTPAYMSPEQLQGRPADVRSDIFCFCVALYEGLAGARPFSGATIDGLRAAIARGPDRERLARAKVPAFLERALSRGLKADPAERYQSMAELLADLERGPIAITRRRRALALALVAVAGGIGVRTALRARAQLCQGAPAELASVWSGDRRARLLAGAQKGDGDALASLVNTLDGYFGAWTAMRKEACEASRLRGEQSEQLLDLRMACLDRSMRNADALVTAVEQRSSGSLKGASSAVAQLPPLSLCANAQALQAVGPLPPDPALRERVASLHKRVAAIEAGRILGGTTLVPEARKLVDEVREIRYPPLLAEAQLALGGVEDQSSDRRSDAAGSCFAAAVTALAAHDDATAARAFTRLLRFENYARRFPEAHQWASLASAAIERLGGDEALELTRVAELARVVRNEGDWEAALDLAQKVLARALRLDGPSSGRVMGAHHDVAQALIALGRYGEGIDEERKALQMALAAHGELHPRTLLLRETIGIAETRRGRLAEGERELRAGLAGNETLAGPEHPDTGDALLNLAGNLREQGRAAEGLPLARRAAAIYRKRLGDKHPRVALADGVVGEALLASGDAAAALAPLESALALAGRGDAHELAELKLSLGEALAKAQRDRPRAVQLLTEARAFYAGLAARQPQPSFQAQLARADGLLARAR